MDRATLEGEIQKIKRQLYLLQRVRAGLQVQEALNHILEGLKAQEELDAFDQNPMIVKPRTPIIGS